MYIFCLKIPETEYKHLVRQITGASFARLEGGDSVIQIIKQAYEVNRQ